VPKRSSEAGLYKLEFELAADTGAKKLYD